MIKLKKQINEKEYNNEFSYKLLTFENHFKNIYRACQYFLKKVLDLIYLMVKIMNIKLKLIKNRKFCMKKQKIKKIFLKLELIWVILC